MHRKVTIQVESIEVGSERFKIAWKTGKVQGEYITFETLDIMLKTLTSKRWQLVSLLQKHGPIRLRELTRLLGRDVKNVHGDVQVLKEVGLIEDNDKGIWVPFDEIEAHLHLAA